MPLIILFMEVHDGWSTFHISNRGLLKQLVNCFRLGAHDAFGAGSCGDASFDRHIELLFPILLNLIFLNDLQGGSTDLAIGGIRHHRTIKGRV